MKFLDAIDLYVADQRRLGRINSPRTEQFYRASLEAHADDIQNRDPGKTGRDDIKRTLGRWPHPNTQRTRHAVLVAFYDWAMEEQLRDTNPARQVRRAKARPTTISRLTRAEVIAMLDAAAPIRRDRWATHLGFLAGLRVQELRGIQRRHFERPGWVHVSADIGKGNRERWVPVLPELAPVVEEILVALGPEDYVTWSRQRKLRGKLEEWVDYTDRPASPQSIWRLVAHVARRAGIARHVNPHLMRHAFGDHVAKYAGLRAAQALLGHASVETTAGTYVDRPTLDEIAVSVHGFSYRDYPPNQGAATPEVETVGIEPTTPADGDPERDERPLDHEEAQNGPPDADGPPRAAP